MSTATPATTAPRVSRKKVGAATAPVAPEVAPVAPEVAPAPAPEVAPAPAPAPEVAPAPAPAPEVAPAAPTAEELAAIARAAILAAIDAGGLVDASSPVLAALRNMRKEHRAALVLAVTGEVNEKEFAADAPDMARMRASVQVSARLTALLESLPTGATRAADPAQLAARVLVGGHALALASDDYATRRAAAVADLTTVQLAAAETLAAELWAKVPAEKRTQRVARLFAGGSANASTGDGTRAERVNPRRDFSALDGATVTTLHNGTTYTGTLKSLGASCSIAWPAQHGRDAGSSNASTARCTLTGESSVNGLAYWKLADGRAIGVAALVAPTATATVAPATTTPGA